MGVTTTPLLDAKQLIRIEGVHRGFLYQHLYAVAWLLSAQSVGAISIIVEHDEDVEITFTDRHLYLQVKTRSNYLNYSDIKDAIQRFDELRREHREGLRHGSASFAVAANVEPGPGLMARLQDDGWPTDVAIHWPANQRQVDPFPFAPWPDINAALAQCTEFAAALPYALLTPETLVWKLAGSVMAAAAGNPPRADHKFRTEELPRLFEQVVFQLQDFPAPPINYRSLADEPPLQSSEKIRIVTGYSGSGKTAWVSQAAIHTSSNIVYYDISETPGPAIASSLSRELAARLFGRSGGQLGEILLPGATGPEILHNIGTRLAAEGKNATIVLDNAHRLQPTDLQTIVQQGHHFKFIFLCQPGKHIQEFEARLEIKSEPLQGWDTDTIALELSDQECIGDYKACHRLALLTAGVPLYVRNAISITRSQYDGVISRFCDDIDRKTHGVETAQEIILAQSFESLSIECQNAIAVLSFSDIPLSKSDTIKLLVKFLGVEEQHAAKLLRRIRSNGCLELLGNDRAKIHDAMRLIGKSHITNTADSIRAQTELKNVLAESLNQDWNLPKLSLYVRMLAQIGDIKTIVQFATEELFHELGIHREIIAFLDEAASSETTDPEDRFWALDGLVFSDVKHGNIEKTPKRIEVMSNLVSNHRLGADERLALAMKRMAVLAFENDTDGVLASFDELSDILPESQAHQRIFRYNAALSLFKLSKYDAAIELTTNLIGDYYDILGIGPEDVIGRNPHEIRPLLKNDPDLPDNLKHLADCLDLHAQAMNATGKLSPFGRIHAMKFYQLANAPDSLIRVGQDLVDEFLSRNDFIGARQMIETNLLPNVLELKMLERVIPVRSQYAVVLACCGDFDAAEAEIARLAPYEAGLGRNEQLELQHQRRVIAQLRIEGPPQQWIPEASGIETERKKKIGRNEPCPCGSGKKYKKCHGR